MHKSTLMASFVFKDELYDAIEKISKDLGIEKHNIFVFKNDEDDSEYILTYNLTSQKYNIKFDSIWKNTISDNLKNAMMEEVNNILEEKVKRIENDNKSLLSDNIHKLKLIRRLKKTLAKEQGVEIHEIKIIK